MSRVRRGEPNLTLQQERDMAMALLVEVLHADTNARGEYYSRVSRFLERCEVDQSRPSEGE